MWVNCTLRSGLLFVTLSFAIAKHKQSFFTKSCCSKVTLTQAVDSLFVKAAWLKATIPEDSIKNIRLLKKKTKKLFMKNCQFQEQLRSFFMEDVFGHLQLQVCKEIHFVDDFCSLRQKLSHCISCPSSAREMKSITTIKKTFYGIGNKGIYKAISELDILLSWIKNFLESIS
ncbi:interleukin-26 [Trichechus manatus latirostris]|uniref:Interleukin family protein n=1 Tax=Trichechus manatus latirostris TaxID=127582 RepID=A0A2Y9E3Q5_TRIMA|nr:interleukin-26 [Trichechus manatus latirostris]